MDYIRKKYIRTLISVLLAVSLVLAPAALFPEMSFADDSDGSSAESARLWDIWVVPEVISGARQPASGGMFAWVTFDYYYAGEGLQNELDPADFMLQMKTQGGEWTDVQGSNIAVLGGDEYYIASFEAIIAAAVPANTDPFIKKWRVVYKPDDAAERIESEVIVQAAYQTVTKDISVFDKTTCFDYSVEQVPWSYDEYKNDHIPPIYIAYVYPDAVAGIRDNDLTISGDHRVVLPWMYGVPWELGENGVSFSTEYLEMMDTELYLGTDPYAEEDEAAGGSELEGGIAALVGYWKSLESEGIWTGGAIPDAEALQRKLSSTVCVPDEDADEYLSYIVEGKTVFWVSGAGTDERAGEGVSDYILVVVRDWEAGGSVVHSYGEPTWTWTGNDASGYTGAEASFVCSNNDGHVRNVRAVVRCTESDDETELTYTAMAVLDGISYTDSKTVKQDESEPVSPAKPEAKPAAKLKPAPVTLNTKTVTAASVKKAVKAAAFKGRSPSQFVIGKKVKKISKNAFKGTGVKTIVVKSKKLTKASVKGSLAGSKVKTVKVKTGSAKVNKQYIKKYKKLFTKKNAGRKASVK